MPRSTARGGDVGRGAGLAGADLAIVDPAEGDDGRAVRSDPEPGNAWRGDPRDGGEREHPATVATPWPPLPVDGHGGHGLCSVPAHAGGRIRATRPCATSSSPRCVRGSLPMAGTGEAWSLSAMDIVEARSVEKTYDSGDVRVEA